MGAYQFEASADDLRMAERLVPDERQLWEELMGEVSRFGRAVPVQGGLRFIARGESTGRTFVISPSSLRQTLVRELARAIHQTGTQSASGRLPQWLLDDLWEIIGSGEEPYAEPYILLAENGKLVGSTTDRLPPQPPRSVRERRQQVRGRWRASRSSRSTGGSSDPSGDV